MAKQRILIVEDEQHLAVGIKYNLEAEGYEAQAVADGPEALEALNDPQALCDLVILDIMLPGMSGYTVCEELRKRNRHLPVLLLSARTLPEDRARGFDVGANQYLTKPFDLEELLSRVRNLLRTPVPPDPPAGRDDVLRRLRFGDAEVDFEQHEVVVAGKSVRMTRLELALLKYLARNEGRVVPREELLENVWEMPPHMATRAPDQFIRRLRKTFEPNPSQPRYFLTVRDAGYRFVSDGKPPS